MGQRGPVTRIASGCAAAEAGKIAAEWLEIDPSGTFRAHFAPAGALRGGTYKYSNKPSGLYHWLPTARPPPFVDSSRGIVVLIDPDQMLLRPITAALGAGLRPSPRKGELVDADGVPRVLGHNLDGIAERVAPGSSGLERARPGPDWPPGKLCHPRTTNFEKVLPYSPFSLLPSPFSLLSQRSY